MTPPSLALLTDKYELTMLAAALRDGTAHRRTTFELFARRLPEGRRYGVVAGTARFVEALAQFRFDDTALASLSDFLDRETLAYLADYQFRGDVDGYAEGELYFPGSPVLSVHGTFAECVVLETLALSIFNHDTAIASAAARMVSAAEGRPLIEMGSRRTHEQAAVAAARAAYLAGFTGSSNLEAQRRYGVPALGTSAHAFTLLHSHRPDRADPDEKAAFRAQVDALGVGTTLLVDTYDITAGVANAVEVAGHRTRRGPHRLRRPGRAGTAGPRTTRRAGRHRRPASWCPATLTSSRSPRCAPNPSTCYGVGTSVVTGSGAPTASMVYKLVEVDGIPVEKRSSHKESHGGRKQALRLAKTSGTIVEEVVHPPAGHRRTDGPTARPDGPAGPRRRTRRRPRPRRRPRAGGGRAAQPAVGRAEAVARRTGDPDADGVARYASGVATGELGKSPSCWPRRSPRSAARERSGQIEMAEAVAHAFDTGEHLAVQAGTGTGKSLAYLVPAIARAVDDATNPVVVSTATIALQRQLVDRDLPRLAEALADALPRTPSSRC